MAHAEALSIRIPYAHSVQVPKAGVLPGEPKLRPVLPAPDECTNSLELGLVSLTAAWLLAAPTTAVLVLARVPSGRMN